MAGLWLTLSLPALAHAAPVAHAGTFTAHPLAGHAVFDLRGGVTSGPDQPTPMLCAELAPHRNFDVEACGTGGGFRADEPGFRFGPATAADQHDAAGVAASASLKGRWWVGGWMYVVGEVSTGAAYIEAAPVVLDQDSSVVPFLTGTQGVGF